VEQKYQIREFAFIVVNGSTVFRITRSSGTTGLLRNSNYSYDETYRYKRRRSWFDGVLPNATGEIGHSRAPLAGGDIEPVAAGTSLVVARKLENPGSHPEA
jgi:hypothetical protein